MDAWRANYLRETIATFQQYETWSNDALTQLDNDKAFFQNLGPRSHSIAVIIKHVAGNLRSRWLNFLTEDGEKPNRHRDQEFEILPSDSRLSLMQAWKNAWTILFDELGRLKPEDLEKTITIRTEPMSVIKAIQRSLAHTAYHAGQILYLCRLLKEGDWKWITIAPGESEKYTKTVASVRA
jgi:uncharacterized damage-inducible protein DinB